MKIFKDIFSFIHRGSKRTQKEFIVAHYDAAILVLTQRIQRLKNKTEARRLQCKVNELQWEKDYYLDFPEQFNDKFK